MTSIRDVAKEAGVAISTVSKVLNHYPNVSPATRAKVEQAVEKLHFVPNAAAAALSSKQAPRIAIIINPRVHSGSMDEINMEYLDGALKAAHENSLDVVTLFATQLNDRPEQEIVQLLGTQSVTGLVVFNINRDQTALLDVIRSGSFYTVVVDAPFTSDRISAVSIDNEQAQYDIAKRIVEENNAKRILYIAGSNEGYLTDARLRGLKRLADEKELFVMVRNGGFSERKAREIAGKYAADNDVVICASDMMAIGAMRKLIEMDIFRPVCGFDGIDLMGYAGKQMLTVRQNFREIAAAAVKECQNLMSGKPGRYVQMPYEIVRMTYEDVIS